MKIDRPKSALPLPSHAKRVFKGILFDVYQWEQKLFDGSTATFEKVKRQDTVDVIPVTADGKIILTKQSQPGITKSFLGCIGGRMDHTGESPVDTAKREMREEAGMNAKKFDLWYAYQPQEKIDWAIYMFIARNAQKIDEQNLDAGEKIKLLYLTFDEFVNTVCDESFRDFELRDKFLIAKQKTGEIEKIRKLLLNG